MADALLRNHLFQPGGQINKKDSHSLAGDGYTAAPLAESPLGQRWPIQSL